MCVYTFIQLLGLAIANGYLSIVKDFQLLILLLLKAYQSLKFIQ